MKRPGSWGGTIRALEAPVLRRALVKLLGQRTKVAPLLPAMAQVGLVLSIAQLTAR